MTDQSPGKRIDKGIRRGRRPSPPVAIVHRAEILTQLQQGASVNEVAQGYAMTGSAISHVLSGDPEYVRARERGIAARLETHYGEMRAAQDMLSLARARECHKATAWAAEREFDRWRQRVAVETTVKQAPTFVVVIAQAPTPAPNEPKLLQNNDNPDLT